jgi:hypothetical protein
MCVLLLYYTCIIRTFDVMIHELCCVVCCVVLCVDYGTCSFVERLCVGGAISQSIQISQQEHSTWRFIDRVHFTCRWEDLDEDDMVSARKRGGVVSSASSASSTHWSSQSVIRHSHYCHRHHHGSITSS